MQALNYSVVESLYADLYKQFTVLGSKNETINSIRSVFFQKRCNLLNDFVVVPGSLYTFNFPSLSQQKLKMINIFFLLSFALFIFLALAIILQNVTVSFIGMELLAGMQLRHTLL